MGGIYLVHVFLLLFVRQTIGNGHIGWYVQHRVSKYGDNLTLLCVVRGCCTKKAGWAKWIPEFTTIFIDVQGLDVSPNFKYDAHVDSNGFTLVIRQFNETDLNIPYSCTYGYDFSPKKFLIKALAFEDKVEKDRNERGEGSSRATHYILVIAFSTIAICVFLGVVVGLIIYYRLHVDKNRSNTRKGMMNDGRGSTKWSLTRRQEERLQSENIVSHQRNGSHRHGRPFSLSRQTSGTSINFHFNSSRGTPSVSSSKYSIYFKAGSDQSDIEVHVDEADEEDNIPTCIPVKLPCANYRTSKTSIRIIENDTGDSSTSRTNSARETLV